MFTYGVMPKPGSIYGRSGNLAKTTLATSHFRGYFGDITEAVAEIQSASKQ